MPSSSLLGDNPPIPPIILCLIECGICAAEQGLPILVVDLVLSNPNAYGDRDLMFTSLDQQRAGMFTQSFGLFHRGVEGAARQDDQKFFSAVAPNGVRVADTVPQLTRQVSQHRVSGRMTVRIVDRFEMVDIQHRNGQRSPITVGENDLTL